MEHGRPDLRISVFAFKVVVSLHNKIPQYGKITFYRILHNVVDQEEQDRANDFAKETHKS